MMDVLLLPIRSFINSLGISRATGLTAWLVLVNALLLAMGISALAPVLFLSLLLAVGLLLVFTQDLQRLQAAVQQLTPGDIHHTQILHTPTIFRALEKSLLNILRGIERHQHQHGDWFEEIAFSANELQGSADQLARNTDQQSNAMESGAAAIVEMSQGIENIAHLVREAADMASDAFTLANTGFMQVEKAAADMQQLDATTAENETAMQQLSEQSNNINAITGIIRSIAEQTNLLALNAAIEAARAGENGRGFAVVADEVRTLARRSHESAEEISRLTSQIIQGIQAAASRMQTMRSMTATSVTAAVEAQQSLTSIQQHTDGLRQHMLSVAANTEQQSQATGEVSARIEEVNQAAQRNSEQALQTARITLHLAELARRTRSTAV